VRGSGTAEPIGAPGGILGVLADSDLALTEVECDLADDDSLVLYTDGVTEARSGIELFGSDRLEALLRSLAGAGPQRLADSVHEAAAKFSANNLRDDLAVLVARSIPLSS
jgi:sigma-B regulation protein RsbU (phosphoserine phosphatase)